jgi:hypothetical protein
VEGRRRATAPGARLIFWQCNNALTGHADRFAREMRLDPKQVREELIAGLNPGVKLVPAHTLALFLVVARPHVRTDRLGGRLTRSGMAVRLEPNNPS